MVFDINKIIPDKSKSIFEGAIVGWDRRSFFYYRMLKAVCTHYGIDEHTPFDDLSAREQKLFLYGTGKEAIEINFTSADGSKSRKSVQPFEGVIPNLKRRMVETDSEYIREELSRLMSSKECPSCHGARLKHEYCHVFVANTSLPSVNAMSIVKAKEFFENIQLSSQEHKIADRILKEIKDRLTFLENVGLGYLNLSRSAEKLSGGEAQRIRLASQIGAGLVGVMYTPR